MTNPFDLIPPTPNPLDTAGPMTISDVGEDPSKTAKTASPRDVLSVIQRHLDGRDKWLGSGVAEPSEEEAGTLRVLRLAEIELRRLVVYATAWAPGIHQVHRPGPVTQEWVHSISMMQQSVLLAAIRGPDGQPKYGGGAKMLLRWYRRCVLLSAMDGKVIDNPIDENGGSFTGPSLNGHDELEPWPERMQQHVHDYLRQVDMLAHHYQLHFMHAVEILGYKHPDAVIRQFWHRLYLRLVHDLHLWPETEEQLDDRLGDTRSGWLKRADPATVA